jgi:hypothetical protein
MIDDVDDLDADLEWQLNTSLSIGPWPVVINADASNGRLRDPDSLEDLRDIHNWSPWFTLRFSDDTTRDVVVGRPDDDGSFTLINAEAAAALEAAAADEPRPDGLLPEPKPVADTTTWLHQHEFTTREHSRGGAHSGSRLFERQDGWRVRYSCVLGTWTLELSPPEHQQFTSFQHLCRDEHTSWRDALPALISDPPAPIDDL